MGRFPSRVGANLRGSLKLSRTNLPKIRMLHGSPGWQRPCSIGLRRWDVHPATYLGAPMIRSIVAALAAFALVSFAAVADDAAPAAAPAAKPAKAKKAKKAKAAKKDAAAPAADAAPAAK